MSESEEKEKRIRYTSLNHRNEIQLLKDKMPAKTAMPQFAGWAHNVFDYPVPEQKKMKKPYHQPSSIFLGPMNAANMYNPDVLSALQKFNIRGIVNCTQLQTPTLTHDDDNDEDVLEYCHVPVRDENGANLLSYFKGTSHFIQKILSEGNSVLVHCQMGVSRSSTVVIAYLMAYHDMKRDEAFLHVVERRPKVRPNYGFWNQLGKWEEQIQKEKEQKNSKEYRDNIINENNFDAFEWSKSSAIIYNTIGSFSRYQLQKHLSSSSEKEARVKVEIPLHPYEAIIPLIVPQQQHQDSSASIYSKNMKKLHDIVHGALTYIWSRGLIDIDLEWFQYLCKFVQKQQKTMTLNDKSEQVQIICVKTIVMSLLTDDESKFRDEWCGEIYPLQIERIENLLL